MTGSGAAQQGPRPPEGDWLGTKFLRFDREGPFGICTLDRPEARNAMTPAMYFGIKYAVNHVGSDPDLAGLLITGARRGQPGHAGVDRGLHGVQGTSLTGVGAPRAADRRPALTGLRG